MQYENTQKSMYLSDDFLTVCAGWLGKQEGTSIEMSCSRNIFREQIGFTSLKVLRMSTWLCLTTRRLFSSMSPWSNSIKELLPNLSVAVWSSCKEALLPT